ncbi:MAG: acyltransferase family protein [Hyphomicrobium sp.]|uniref:acyltransferase family protein n=1 Tax=Hyphomicrobium sp. TaxID=82 RepID=UPI003D0B5075
MNFPSRLHAEQMSYLPHVDGLRALAVALVVVYHAWPDLVPGGFIGVDVFFVISGFIITRQIAVEMETGTFSYSAFLGRRMRRLIPAAFVCCLLTTIAALVVLMPDAMMGFGESLAAVWTMTANFYFYAKSGYFDAPSAQAPLLHMWSLAVEDQFYLTWPLLLLVMFRRIVTRPKILAAVLVLLGLSLAHSELSARSDPSLAFFLPLSRAFELLAGCALALALALFKRIAVRAPVALIDALGLALVAASAIALHAQVPFPGLAVVPTIAGSVLLIGAGLARPTPVSRLLSLRPVVLTGKMSYSIYLYHWPVLALANYWLGRAPDGLEAFLLVALGLVLAALSWLLVEQRLTRQLGLATMPPLDLFKRTATIGAAFCAFAIVSAWTRGLPARLDESAYKVYSAAASSNPLRKVCDGYDLALNHDGRCTFGRPLQRGASYDIAVFGDSNGDHFVPMIAKLAEEAGLSGRQVTQSTCGILIGASRPQDAQREEACTRYQETVLEFLKRNPHLKIAVLASRWSSYAHATTNRVAAPDGKHQVFPLSHFAQQTIDLFRKRGVKVLVVGQVPHLETFSLRCFADAARRDMEAIDCALPRPVAEAELAATQSVLEAIDKADDGVSLLDMKQLLCTEKLCSAFKDEVLLYRDRGHLNAVGSAYLARYASLPKIDGP